MTDFEQIYGKPVDKMDEGEYKVVVLGLLHGLAQRLDKMNGNVADTMDCVSRHKTYFRIVAAISCGIIFPLMVWLIIRALA